MKSVRHILRNWSHRITVREMGALLGVSGPEVYRLGLGDRPLSDERIINCPLRDLRHELAKARIEEYRDNIAKLKDALRNRPSDKSFAISLKLAVKLWPTRRVKAAKPEAPL